MTRRPRRAYLLVEMLFVIALFALFGVLAGKLFTTMLRQIRDASALSPTTSSFDSALTQLRADAWSADLLQSDGPTLVITHPTGTTTWSITPTDLSRTDASSIASVQIRHWPHPPACSFAIDHNTLLLTITQPNTPPETLPLPTELATLKGTTP